MFLELRNHPLKQIIKQGQKKTKKMVGGIAEKKWIFLALLQDKFFNR
jgi:hypothetical protein